MEFDQTQVVCAICEAKVLPQHYTTHLQVRLNIKYYLWCLMNIFCSGYQFIAFFFARITISFIKRGSISSDFIYFSRPEDEDENFIKDGLEYTIKWTFPFGMCRLTSIGCILTKAACPWKRSVSVFPWRKESPSWVTGTHSPLVWQVLMHKLMRLAV